MRIFTDVDAYASTPVQNPLVLALGNFDGLHLGHAALIKQTAAVLTFQEHPQQVLHPQTRPKLLTSMDQRLFLFEKLGIRDCFLLHFTREFSGQSAESFIEEILIKRLKVKKVCLGTNARFGHDRKGDVDLMRRYGKKAGFEVEEMAPVKAAGDVVSSSRIRKLIENGSLEEAAECLGRPFSVFASVIKGEGRGKQIGYPTANLEPDAEVLPPFGVYPARLRVLSIHKKPVRKGEEAFSSEALPWLNGVANFGERPTFESQKKVSLEIHLFDFKEDLYGKRVEIAFYPRLRPEQKFAGSEALKNQIEKDVRQAKERFTNLGISDILTAPKNHK